MDGDVLCFDLLIFVPSSFEEEETFLAGDHQVVVGMQDMGVGAQEVLVLYLDRVFTGERTFGC